MWTQNYTPLGGSLWLSALVASLPVFVLLFLIGIKRKPAWVSALSGLGAAAVVALLVYQMPVGLMLNSTLYGAAFGLFPIGWIVYWAIVLYKVTESTGKFEIIKDSIGGLTSDRRLQALLIAFAFGAFVEGAAGFGTPVAVAAAMLAGLGFSPFYAAGICLLANTAPVAFGSIGIPVVTLARITGLSEFALSAWVGRICAPISVFIPAYLIMVMGGWKGLSGVLPAAAICGIAFASAQFFVSNYIGPQLTDILAALSALLALVLLLKVWKPKDTFVLPDSRPMDLPKKHTLGEVILAWSPYLFLVFFVLLSGLSGNAIIKNAIRTTSLAFIAGILDSVNTFLASATRAFDWPGLAGNIIQVSPVTATPGPYPADQTRFTLNILSASGTACLAASLASMLVLRLSPGKYFGILMATGRSLFKSMVTIASVLGLAYLLNFCGATATMGLAFSATGAVFPFFSAMLGWLAVFLTGSDTSANALFGNLQVVTAKTLHLSPELMASANSAGGVMGKMISLQSIAVAAAATGMASTDEAKLFRFTLKHSVFLASMLGLIVMLYAYVIDWPLPR
ncbi:MAG: L-lactate permease [Acidobacteriota bacterium]